MRRLRRTALYTLGVTAFGLARVASAQVEGAGAPAGETPPAAHAGVPAAAAEVVPPSLEQQVVAVYPAEALAQRFEGTVGLELQGPAQALQGVFEGSLPPIDISQVEQRDRVARPQDARLLEPRDRMQKRQLDLGGQRGRDAVRVDSVVVQPLGLEKNLMPIPPTSNATRAETRVMVML